MRKLIVGLLVLLMVVPVGATPVAMFDTSTELTQTATPTETLPEETLQEIEVIKALYLEMLAERGVVPYLISPDLTIPASEYTNLYNKRMTAHNSGTNPLPIRYLSNDYDNNMTIADAMGTNRNIMYEVVMGYPIFYRIERYNRPTNFTQLNALPTVNADRLNVSALGISGKVGSLRLQ